MICKVVERVGDVAGWSGRVELRCLIPLVRRAAGTVAKRLVGKERKEAILQDGAADAATKVVVAGGVAHQALLRRPCHVVVRCVGRQRKWLQRLGTVVAIEGIQAGTHGTEEQAAVDLVGATLRGDLQVRSAETAEFRVVAVAGDLDAVDRIGIGSDDAGAAPHGRGGADAVDVDAVGLILASAGEHLGTVLR